ncbi:MAG TPA: hypothetical protein VHK91_09115 [Flavisolibacter sp.]|jgi:hypothetical protein|nr:hypothetical protein [Flavisolibacter sp.]
MKAIFHLLTMISCIAKAQTVEKIRKIDSVEYYKNELGKLVRQNSEALRRSERFQEIFDNMVKAIKKRNNYSSLVVSIERAHSDYKVFNNKLVQNGFSPLQPSMVRVGFGFGNKRGRAIYDIYLANFGFSNKSVKGNEKITTLFSNLFQFDFGIDILKVDQVSFYPYGGLSIRFSELNYEKTANANSNYAFISDIATDDNSIELQSARLGYQYGVGFDYAFSNNSDKTYKTIVFIKAGVNRPFKEDTYKSKYIQAYKPEIRQGDWLLSVGIKLANKR